MPLVLCPNCFRRVPVTAYDTDVVHDCNSGNPSIDNESMLAMALHGTDIDGSAINRSAPNLQGIVNRLNGTVGGIQGEDAEPMNRQGKRVSTQRQRKKFQYFTITPRTSGIKVYKQ